MKLKKIYKFLLLLAMYSGINFSKNIQEEQYNNGDYIIERSRIGVFLSQIILGCFLFGCLLEQCK